MYFCAFGLLFLIPLVYLVCQVLTWSVYEGRWRRLSLLPIAVVGVSFVPLLFVQTQFAFFVVCLAAPAAGLVALGCVWFAYAKAQNDAGSSGDLGA